MTLVIGLVSRRCSGRTTLVIDSYKIPPSAWRESQRSVGQTSLRHEFSYCLALPTGGLSGSSSNRTSVWKTFSLGSFLSHYLRPILSGPTLPFALSCKALPMPYTPLKVGWQGRDLVTHGIMVRFCQLANRPSVILFRKPGPSRRDCLRHRKYELPQHAFLFATVQRGSGTIRYVGRKYRRSETVLAIFPR